MNDNNYDFNNALIQYKMKKMVGLSSIYNIPSLIGIENNVTCLNNCTILEGCNFNNLTTNNFYIYNNILNLTNITVKSDFYIQNDANINNISINNTLVVNNSSILNNNISISSDLYVLGTCDILNYVTSANILVNNTSIFNNITCFNNLNTSLNITCNNIMANNLSVINNSILYNTVTVISNLYTNNIISNIITSGSTLTCKNLLINSNSSINTSLYVSNITNIIGNINISTICNITNNIYTNSIVSNKLVTYGNIICNLPEYIDNTTAAANGIPYNGLYRLGGVVKIRLDLISPIILLNGDAIINTYINNVFIDPRITISDNLNEILQPIITGSVTTTILGTYNLSYYVIDSCNNKSNIVYRTVNVINYPIISNILLASKIITFTLTGIYNTLIYKITKNDIIILPETQLLSNSIDTTNITLDLIPYNIILLLKDLNNSTIKTIIIGLTSTKIGPVLEIFGFNPYYVNTTTSYNVLTNIKAYTLPSTALTISTSIKDNLNNIKTLSSGILSIAYNSSYKITYSITDSSNININYQLDVLILDNTIPVITLIGASTIYVDKYSVYTDQGYNVSDNSGQFTVTVTGYVNTLNLGTYYIIYTVTDLSNNKNKVIRTVIVRDDIIVLNPPIITTIDQYSPWTDPGYILQSGFSPVFSSIINTNSNQASTHISTYTATDIYSSKTVSRTVIVRPSVLKIIFNVWNEYRIFDWLNTMYTQLNTPFVDPGYFITDSSVILSIVSNVNTSIAGVYKIVYTTIDANNIKSIGTRYVVVNDGCFISYNGTVNDPSNPDSKYYNCMGWGFSHNTSERVGDAPAGMSALNQFWFGYKGSTISFNLNTVFDYNGSWSIMMKVKFRPFWIVRFDFDNVFDRHGNPVGTQPLNTINFYGNAYGASISGPTVTTVYYTTFPIIAACIVAGVYIVLNRLNNYNILKIYSLAHILLCDVTSKVPFIYTQKQQVFSIIVDDYAGSASLGGGIYYKKTELFPSDWNPICLISKLSNNNLYLTI